LCKIQEYTRCLWPHSACGTANSYPWSYYWSVYHNSWDSSLLCPNWQIVNWSWFGFSGSLLNWFLFYLSDRIQMVKICDFFSERTNIPFGDSQGSVHGPILFSLYTYPLSHVITTYSNIGYHFYADETQIYCHLSNYQIFDVTILWSNPFTCSNI
jgi:hypothetical protein